MDDKVWNEGEPPHIGWWLTKDRNNVQRWCWWDGNFFLYYAQALGNLLWTDYYPEGARVPRVDPSDPKNAPIVAFINATGSASLPGVWEKAAWEMHCRVQNPATAGTTRTVREMKERMKPGSTSDVPARTSSNGQAYLEAHEKLHKSLIPDYRELSAAPTRELMRELFRRLG